MHLLAAMASPPDSIPVDLGEQYLSDMHGRAEQYLSTPSEASSMLGGSSGASSLVGEDGGLDDYRMERAYTDLHEVYGNKIEVLEQKVRELGDDAAATVRCSQRCVRSAATRPGTEWSLATTSGSRPSSRAVAAVVGPMQATVIARSGERSPPRIVARFVTVADEV